MASTSKWTADDIPDQHDRVAVITGANSGLGLCSARELARHGAQVVLACRSPERGAAALAEVESVATGAAPTLLALDLADLSSVERAAGELAGSVEQIDILLNNAGVMALPRTRTVDGFEAQFGTNHLGHYALTGRLLPLLLAAPSARVVTTSSSAHRMGKMHWDDLNWDKGYQKWPAYGQSKLANLLFTMELDRRAKAHEVPLLSVAGHPGYASTHLQAAGPEMAGNGFMVRVMEATNNLVAQPAEMGALPQLYAATMDGVAGGEYYGPGGLMEVRGHPKKVQATRPAYGTEEAAKLWAHSQELTGVIYDWAPAHRD